MAPISAGVGSDLGIWGIPTGLPVSYIPTGAHVKNTVSDLYSKCPMVAGLACIFLHNRPVLQDKCQSGLTEGTVWDNTLAMAPVLIHASKEPDGEV